MLAGRQRVAVAESALTEMMRRMQQAPPPLRTMVLIADFENKTGAAKVPIS